MVLNVICAFEIRADRSRNDGFVKAWESHNMKGSENTTCGEL